MPEKNHIDKSSPDYIVGEITTEINHLKKSVDELKKEVNETNRVAQENRSSIKQIIGWASAAGLFVSSVFHGAMKYLGVGS